MCVGGYRPYAVSIISLLPAITGGFLRRMSDSPLPPDAGFVFLLHVGRFAAIQYDVIVPLFLTPSDAVLDVPRSFLFN